MLARPRKHAYNRAMIIQQPVPMFRHAKILATLGPSSESEPVLRELIQSGASGFRMNFSHGTADEHRARAAMVRKLATEMDKPIFLLQDLQGPKIRVGTVDGNVQLTEGQTFTLDADTTVGDATRVYLPHPEILQSLQVGSKFYVNDGLIRMTVTEKHDGKAVCTVTAGGTLSSRKGVNVPGLKLPISSLTAKDREDLKVGLDIGVDWLALSFVQSADDIAEARKLTGGRGKIMAKIETIPAVENIESIIAAADGIMFARGDLGVELPTEEVPPLQKKITRLCREAGKPVVIATQMLDSMVRNPSPTRAEASDVANAAYEGADVLMLSNESAAGAYPIAAVKTMDSIIRRVETSSAWEPLMNARPPQQDGSVQDAITAGACSIAQAVGAKVVVTFTETGGTAMHVARWRPQQPVLCLTPHAQVARQLGMLWGVWPIVCPPITRTEDMVNHAANAITTTGIAEKGEKMVITAGVPFAQTGSTNVIRVYDIT